MAIVVGLLEHQQRQRRFIAPFGIIAACGLIAMAVAHIAFERTLAQSTIGAFLGACVGIAVWFLLRK